MEATKIDAKGFGAALARYFIESMDGRLQLRMVQTEKGVYGIITSISGTAFDNTVFVSTGGKNQI